MNNLSGLYTNKHILPEEFRSSIGDYTYGTPEISGHGAQYLKIGKFCSIAGGVRIILGGGHDYTSFTTYPFDSLKYENQVFIWNNVPAPKDIRVGVEDIGVFIGNDVWIGCGATILPSVHIGNGAVIGACAVVAKDVLPYEIVVGNPVRTIRKRFIDRQIEQLERIAWWNWDIKKIEEALPLLHQDIEVFIQKYGTD